MGQDALVLQRGPGFLAREIFQTLIPIHVLRAASKRPRLFSPGNFQEDFSNLINKHLLQRGPGFLAREIAHASTVRTKY